MTANTDVDLLLVRQPCPACEAPVRLVAGYSAPWGVPVRAMRRIGWVPVRESSDLDGVIAEVAALRLDDPTITPVVAAAGSTPAPACPVCGHRPHDAETLEALLDATEGSLEVRRVTLAISDLEKAAMDGEDCGCNHDCGEDGGCCGGGCCGTENDMESVAIDWQGIRARRDLTRSVSVEAMEGILVDACAQSGFTRADHAPLQAKDVRRLADALHALMGAADEAHANALIDDLVGGAGDEDWVEAMRRTPQETTSQAATDCTGDCIGCGAGCATRTA